MADAGTLRALDCETATRVMGLKTVTATPEHPAVSTGCLVHWGTWIDTGRRHVRGPIVEQLQAYSADIACAWVVVEEMAKRHVPMSLYSLSHGMYVCFFGSPVSPIPAVPDAYPYIGRRPEARSMNPAEAICRAALLYLDMPDGQR